MKLESQVNARLCSLQYALNEQLTITKILTEPLSRLRNWCCRKIFFSFKLLIHDFHKKNNSFLLNYIQNSAFEAN